MEWEEVKDAFKRHAPVYYFGAGGTPAGGTPIECLYIAEYGWRTDANGYFYRFVGAIGAAANCMYRGAPEAFGLTAERAKR